MELREDSLLIFLTLNDSFLTLQYFPKLYQSQSKHREVEMRSFTCLTIFILSLRFSESVFDLIENDQCSSEFTGDNGVCVEASNCEEFKTHRNKLKICSFRDKIPLVCCPAVDAWDLGKSGEISRNRISARSKIIVDIV